MCVRWPKEVVSHNANRQDCVVANTGALLNLDEHYNTTLFKLSRSKGKEIPRVFHCDSECQRRGVESQTRIPCINVYSFLALLMNSIPWPPTSTCLSQSWSVRHPALFHSVALIFCVRSSHANARMSISALSCPMLRDHQLPYLLGGPHWSQSPQTPNSMTTRSQHHTFSSSNSCSLRSSRRRTCRN